MAICTQPVQPAIRSPIRAFLFVALAIGLPILAGLVWHRSSDNPIWPLVRNSLARCELNNAPLSPLSPGGLYRARVVRATCFGRFTETLVFVTPADAAWPPATLDPTQSVLEIAGVRSLDAIDWQQPSGGRAPILQLWFAPGALPAQIHRLQPNWRDVTIQPRTSTPTPGGRLDY